MGRRRNRKLERRQRQSTTALLQPSIEELDLMDDEALEALVMNHMRQPFAPPPALCGACKEFIEDREGGRGTCLHPGSGVLSPWTDTAGCDFFTPRRR